MATYVVKLKPPSVEEWRTWVQMGYLGSYEQYAARARETVGQRMFLSGDLGPHCSDCLAPGENLCDYPVGEGKTCDRLLCDEHAKRVSHDTHYCRDHWLMWMEYLASERGYEVLHNVTPIPSATEPRHQTVGGSNG